MSTRKTKIITAAVFLISASLGSLYTPLLLSLKEVQKSYSLGRRAELLIEACESTIPRNQNCDIFAEIGLIKHEN